MAAVVWLFSLAVAAGIARHLPACIGVGTASACVAWRRGRAGWIVPVLAAVCAAVGAAASVRLERERAWVGRAAGRAGSARLELTGRVCGFPRSGPHGSAFAFATRVDGRRVRLQVYADFFDVSLGDEYRVRARLLRPSDSEARALASRGLSGVARVRQRETVRLGAAANTAPGASALWRLHRAARTRLSRAMGGDAGLAIGMLLGERGQMSEDARAAVRRLGISHLLAISGMHLTAIAACVVFFTRWWPRWTVPALVAALTLYTGVVGDVESLWRAYLMSLVMMLAHATVRPVSAVDALGRTLLVMALASPLSLLSVGLQLSFAATFALLLVLPSLRSSRTPTSAGGPARRLRPAARAVAVAFAISVAVEVFIAPLQIHHFGALSVVGPAATVVFLVPVTLILLAAIPVAACASTEVVGDWLARALAAASTATVDSIVALGRAAPPPVRLPEPAWWLYYPALVLIWRGRRRGYAWLAGLAGVAAAFALGR